MIFQVESTPSSYKKNHEDQSGGVRCIPLYCFINSDNVFLLVISGVLVGELRLQNVLDRHDKVHVNMYF